MAVHPETGVEIFEANAELVLLGAPTEPLAELKMKGADPLQTFAEAIGSARDEWLERVRVCMDVMPVPNDKAKRVREYWLSKATDEVGYVDQEELQRLPQGKVVQRRQDTARLASKLDPKEILFEIQVLIHVESTEYWRPTEMLRAILTGFGQWKGSNEFTVHGQVFGPKGFGLRFFGVDADLMPWRRWWFHLRLRTGLFWPSKLSLVTAWEIAGWLKPITKWNTSSAPIRSSGSVDRAPVALPDIDVLPDVEPVDETDEEKEAVG